MKERVISNTISPKHQGRVEDGDTSFAFGNEAPVEIDEGRWGMGRPFVRVGDWEMGCYIYDNFFEIQVRMAMEVTEVEL